MRIWFHQNIDVAQLAPMGKNTLGEHLGMQFVEIGDDYLIASMPVDSRTHQPYGILHGGASVALAETVGSIAAALVVDHEKFLCVGLDINANHVKSVRSGTVFAKATPLHLGASTHVWDIKITNEQGSLVCISRLTVSILQRKGKTIS